MDFSKKFSRLPRTCIPLHYTIELTPCMKTLSYTGKQSITVQVKSSTSEIVLNSRDLTIVNAKFNGSPVKVVPEPEQDKISFQLAQPCQVGTGKLDIEFMGGVSDKMKGFYKSKYTTVDGQEKVMLVTHFEPTNARLAFPCWDEPDFKSIFTMKFVIPKNLTAISNMPLMSKTEAGDGCDAYLFEDTPKMSTYLVAFAIGEFEYIEACDSNAVRVRVYSRPNMVLEHGRGELALDVTCRSLPFFGDYFGTRYPLPKVDLLAIPDFAGGAMENWGLITFRERTLLVEKETASPSSKQLVGLVVSHELAHMWFGNLVTMHWWTDLWLKEGFANWIEFLCVDHCFPEWNIWDHFTHDQMACSLRLDALDNSHPIEVEVNHPDEIEEIFDTISYCKGASLIRMLHAYLGDDVFRTGLRTYLAQHAYGNAVTADLWAALSSASNIDVAGLMKQWTQTSGFPVVKVTPLELKHGHISVRLEQEKYHLPSSNPHKSSRKWTVPIVLTCHSVDGKFKSILKYLLDDSASVINVPVTWSLTSLSDCIVQVNAEATGLYHVCYNPEQFNLFINHFHTISWTVPGKMAFFNDAFSLAKVGLVPIGKLIKVLPPLMANEGSFSIWRCVLVDGLSPCVCRLVHEGDLSVESYHSFLRKLVRPALNRLGFLPSKSHVFLSHDGQLLRSQLVLTAGAEAGDPEVVAEAERRFAVDRRGDGSDTAIPGDLRLAVLCTVVGNRTDPEALDYLMKLYPTVVSPDERTNLLSAICSAGTQQVDRVLKFCLDPNGPVRDQDRANGLMMCASGSGACRVRTWEAMKSNWDRLTYMYSGQFILSRLLQSVLSGFATNKNLEDVKNFLATHPVACTRAVKQIYEILDANQIILVRDKTHVASALKE